MSPVIKTLPVDIASLEAEDMNACVTYWNELRRQRFAPSWKEFDLLGLPPFMAPFFLVVDVNTAPLDFVYRFWGSGHTSYHGRDYTGQPVTAIELEWAADLLFDQYRQVYETHQAMAFTTQYEGIEHPATSVRLPLSDDGQSVTHIFGYAERRHGRIQFEAVFDPTAS